MVPRLKEHHDSWRQQRIYSDVNGLCDALSCFGLWTMRRTCGLVVCGLGKLMLISRLLASRALLPRTGPGLRLYSVVDLLIVAKSFTLLKLWFALDVCTMLPDFKHVCVCTLNSASCYDITGTRRVRDIDPLLWLMFRGRVSIRCPATLKHPVRLDCDVRGNARPDLTIVSCVLSLWRKGPDTSFRWGMAVLLTVRRKR